MFLKRAFCGRWLALGAVLSASTAFAATPVATLAVAEVPALFSLQAGEADVTYVESSGNCPVTFDLTYTVVSDYVFRGVNRSEYGNEGRERANHQFDVTMGFDVGELFGQQAGQCGTFSFTTWFEWYGAQKSLDPEGGGQNLQEVDYAIAWSYDLDSIGTTMSLGYTWYTFPNDNAINSSEWWIGFEHNDAWMWGWLLPDNEEGVLNPTFKFIQDVDRASGGSLFEFGFSHGFGLFDNFTLTPSLTVMIDHTYYGQYYGTGGGSTHFAYMEWGLDASYNLTPMLQLPEWAGDVTLSGFLYFSDAVGSLESNGVLQDEFYGGMSIGWSF